MILTHEEAKTLSTSSDDTLTVIRNTEAAVIAKLCAGVEMPEPISYVSFNKQGDISRVIKRKDSWTNTPVFTVEQLQIAAQPAQIPAQPRLKVRLTAFPESNGKRNWTALLVREEKWDGLVGNCGGVSLARGELWNRVAWEAECARYLIGERDTEPFILDYGDDIETPDQWPGETHDRHRSRTHALKSII